MTQPFYSEDGARTRDRAPRIDWLPWLRRWADLLDSRFRIPGTSIRFGLDPILSLVPGVGDLASPVFTVLLLVQGLRQRVPRLILARMAVNALVDAVVGVVPVGGAVADVFWRANIRNLTLLERHARPGRPPDASEYLFVFALAAVVGVVAMVVVLAGLWLAALLWLG